MQWLLVLPGYLLWHYTIAWRDITHVWMNMLWFVNRVFSISFLFATLFSPWKRMVEHERAGFDLERAAENFVVNMMSRLVGALVRLPIILCGLFSLVSTFIFGLLFYIFWFCAPVVIITLFGTGIYLLFI